MAGVHHCRNTTLATFAAAALVACADAATPLAPPDAGPALAANTTGPLAIESII